MNNTRISRSQCKNTHIGNGKKNNKSDRMEMDDIALVGSSVHSHDTHDDSKEDWRNSLKIGDYVDAFNDNSERWLGAEVVGIEFKIHYNGYATKYDETLSIDSHRLAAMHSHEQIKQVASSVRNNGRNNGGNNGRKPVRLICVSDTHNSHDQLTDKLCKLYESESDVLIHAGDMTDCGSLSELEKVNSWFGKLPFKRDHIIVIAGNMDGIGLDRSRSRNRNNYHSNSYYNSNHKSECVDTAQILTNAVYLEHDSYHLKQHNLRFFGSPYSMKFVGGFQITNKEQADRLWRKIPENTDVLVCHGPAKGILDVSRSSGQNKGDSVLLDHVLNRVKPKVMISGHMHNSYGEHSEQGIRFFNVAQDNALNKHNSWNSRSSKHKEQPRVVVL